MPLVDAIGRCHWSAPLAGAVVRSRRAMWLWGLWRLWRLWAVLSFGSLVVVVGLMRVVGHDVFHGFGVGGGDDGVEGSLKGDGVFVAGVEAVEDVFARGVLGDL